MPLRTDQLWKDFPWYQPHQPVGWSERLRMDHSYQQQELAQELLEPVAQHQTDPSSCRQQEVLREQERRKDHSFLQQGQERVPPHPWQASAWLAQHRHRQQGLPQELVQ